MQRISSRRGVRGISPFKPIRTQSISLISCHTNQHASISPARTITTTAKMSSPATKMETIQVRDWAEGPRLVKVDKPTPAADQIQLRVLAAGLHSVVRSRAAGRHYSAKTLPHVPGIDGVGRDEATGQLYYFMSMADGAGSFAEYVTLPRDDGGAGILVPLPADADPFGLAGAVNPALSGWMALALRTTAPRSARGDEGGPWTALVLGATSASGRLAAHAARAMGATRVVGAARDEAALRADPALDGYVVLQADVAATDFSSVQTDMDAADVVLDYVYGDVTAHFFAGLRTKKPVQYVHIGTLSGQPDVPINGPLLRSTDLTIRGAGPGSWRLSAAEPEIRKMIPALLKWPAPDAVKIPLRDIEKAWNDKSIKGRIVVVP